MTAVVVLVCLLMCVVVTSEKTKAEVDRGLGESVIRREATLADNDIDGWLLHCVRPDIDVIDAAEFGLLPLMKSDSVSRDLVGHMV
ncbi:hypothetical protein BsWGS_06885 [Bradybaena similaris]